MKLALTSWKFRALSRRIEIRELNKTIKELIETINFVRDINQQLKAEVYAHHPPD